MNPYALWQIDEASETTEINSLETLDELLDELTLKAKNNKMPFSVQICLNDKSALMIIIGTDISHMEFYSKSHQPPIVVSVGEWSKSQQEEAFTAIHGGELSTINKKSCVPIEDARNAVRHYFKTGDRPKNITWTN